jgi:hypothetical protein
MHFDALLIQFNLLRSLILSFFRVFLIFLSHLSNRYLRHLVDALIHLKTLNTLTVVNVPILSYQLKSLRHSLLFLLLKVPIFILPWFEHFLNFIKNMDFFVHAV